MSRHNHDHHHHHATDNIRVAFFINLAFTVIEIVGGLFTNSLAILADAVHDLGDSLALGLAWYFQKLSGRGRDQDYSYGYRRFSVLGGIINALVLLVGSFIIIREAIPRLLNPTMPHTTGMMVLAVLGVLFNGLAVWRLQGGKSINERVVTLHLLEDVLGWVAVLIGSIVMHFFDFPIIDPLLSVGISLFILYNAFRNLRRALRIVMQAIPSDQDLPHIREILLQLPAIRDLHDIHLWSLDGEYHILTIHAVLSEEKSITELAALKQEIRQLLHEQHIGHVTVEFEMPEENCELMDC